MAVTGTQLVLIIGLLVAISITAGSAYGIGANKKSRNDGFIISIIAFIVGALAIIGTTAGLILVY
jgi:hypothetical protein